MDIYTIYCIEDINDLKYIGVTKQSLEKRLYYHRYCLTCSSKKLNLYNCIIYPLEKCNEEEKFQREKYYIQNTDCVNERKYLYDTQEKIIKRQKEYYIENKEKIIKRQKKRSRKINLKNNPYTELLKNKS